MMGKAERKAKRSQRKEKRSARKTKRKETRSKRKATKRGGQSYKDISTPVKQQLVKEHEAFVKKSKKTGVAVMGGVVLAGATAVTGGGIVPIILAGGLGTVGTSLLVKSPTTRQSIVTLPSKAMEYGEQIAGKIEDDPIVKEKIGSAPTIPALGYGLVGTALGITGKSLWDYFKTKTSNGNGGVLDKPLPSINGVLPIAPQTEALKEEKQPQEAPLSTIAPSVKQSVKININNSPHNTGLRINKKYINKVILK